MITIQELLTKRGLSGKIKMVRHLRTEKDSNRKLKVDLHAMYRHNRKDFYNYQAAQSKPVFRGADYIVSFIGEDNNCARFVGVFKIIAERPIDEVHRIDPRDIYYYDMEEVPGFEDLKEHIIVRWKNGLAWVQWFKNDLEVVEISSGILYTEFKGYDDILLTFEELSEIINHKYADWQKLLSSVSGVYAISDTLTGQLYIGSAYNKEGGIWGRWGKYVETGGHGGNKKLETLINKDPNYAQNFMFSILRILPKTETKDNVIACEHLFKHKLDTIKHGLNDN